MSFDALLERCRSLPPLKTAVVHPCDETALRSAIAARDARLIEPVLVGPRARIEALARTLQLDLTGVERVDVPHSHAAAERGAALARWRAVDALMKGSLHTDELLSEVLRKESALRTGRRVSHVFLMQVPSYPKLLLITDGAINIAPTLEEKADIVRNVIDLAHILGIEQPKVALLSAVETVESRIPSTVDAAALCKMAERGQISGALLEGPLALDNAISRTAAGIKHLESPVAGAADVLVVPNLEAGNLLAKELSFLAGASSAGIVLGARVPIMLTSRADSIASHLTSCAVAVLVAHAARGVNPRSSAPAAPAPESCAPRIPHRSP